MSVSETPTIVIEGHPVNTYFLESELIHQLLEEIKAINPKRRFSEILQCFYNHLAMIEKRFERKENQLFPFLEQKGWTGPSRNMWSFHDTIREMFRIVRKNLEEQDFTSAEHNTNLITQNLYRLLDVEENVLFPNALELLY